MRKQMRIKTPLQYIRAKCLDCASTYPEVKNCEFADCPLHQLRFGKHLPKGMSRLKAIRTYCVNWCMNEQPNEVRLCPVTYCQLYPYRFGRNPYRKRSNESETTAENALEFKKVAADAGFLQRRVTR
jgi:hypothetical protein